MCWFYEVIFRNIKNKSRGLVAHYFFPAEINLVVELVPGKETDAKLVNLLHNMIKIDPDKRYNVIQCLKHSYFY